jgi:hypothetical protein
MGLEILEFPRKPDDEGNWAIKTPGKGIYVAAGEVRLIEFIPYNAGVPT